MLFFGVKICGRARQSKKRGLFDIFVLGARVKQCNFNLFTLAFELHYRFVSIHPFADGNGRTTRLLMNYVLTMFDLPIFYVFKGCRIPYIQALKRARETDNPVVFYNFMYRQYLKFIEKELKMA